MNLHSQRLFPLNDNIELHPRATHIRICISPSSSRLVALPRSLSRAPVSMGRFFILLPLSICMSNSEEFERISEGLSDALGFTRTIGLGSQQVSYEQGGGRGVLGEVDFYTRYPFLLISMTTVSYRFPCPSHEGLMLEFEEAMTRQFPIPSSLSSSSQSSISNGHSTRPNIYYNTSAHFLWIGDRTRQLDGAHVEYFRGIRNPIGIKVGPSMDSDELKRLLDSKSCILRQFSSQPSPSVVNPDREDGKVTLITRYGAGKASRLKRHSIWYSSSFIRSRVTSQAISLLSVNRVTQSLGYVTLCMASKPHSTSF